MNFPQIEFHKFTNHKQLRARKVKNNEKGKISVTKNMNLIKMVSYFDFNIFIVIKIFF